MNRSAKREAHEKARKRHKHEQQEHARELAKRGRSAFPFWMLIVGGVLLIGGVLLVSFM